MSRVSGVSPSSASGRDIAALQGSWEQVALEVDGVANPPDDHGAPGALTTFTGDRFVVRTVEGCVLLEGRFVLDASTTPGSITWIDSTGPDRGKELPASYRLEGDRFVFIAGDEGASRPVVFHTVAGQTMRTFARRA